METSVKIFEDHGATILLRECCRVITLRHCGPLECVLKAVLKTWEAVMKAII